MGQLDPKRSKERRIVALRFGVLKAKVGEEIEPCPFQGHEVGKEKWVFEFPEVEAMVVHLLECYEC